MKRIILVAAVIAIAMSGCVSRDSVRIHALEDISVSLGMTSYVNALVKVENSSCRRIRLDNAVFRITDDRGNELATLTNVNEIVLPRRSVSNIELPLRIRVTNPLVGLSLLRNIKDHAPTLRVTGTADIRMGVTKKKYEVNDAPLSYFLSIFDEYFETSPELNIL